MSNQYFLELAQVESALDRIAAGDESDQQNDIIATFNLRDGHYETDAVLVQLHIAQRLLYYFQQELPLSGTLEPSSVDLKALEALSPLVFGLLERVNLIFSLALDFSLPKSLHYSACHTLDMFTAVSLSKLRQISPTSPLLDAWSTYFHSGLKSLFAASFGALSPTFEPKHALPLSNILSIIGNILKCQVKGQENEDHTGNLVRFWLTDSDTLQNSYLSLLTSISNLEDNRVFRTLAPISITILKRMMLHYPVEGPRLSAELALRLLLTNEDEDQIRDLLTARRIFSVLRREFDDMGSDPAQLVCASPKFLSIVQRVIPVLFSGSTLPSHPHAPESTSSLLTNAYKIEATTSNESKEDSEENPSLQRTVVLYTLSVCARLLSTTIETETALSSQILLLARTLAGRGLFSVNPISFFFDLFGDHDENLLEALYWLQKILLSSSAPNHPHQTHQLFDWLRSKVSQLEPLLGVLNPHSLFVSFLYFLGYDHSILMDFMLSSESQWVLMYLLDYVKLSLSDWDRTFVVLYNLKTKKIKQQDNRVESKTKAQSGNRMDTPPTTQPEIKVLPEDVDSLLEVLLLKQMEELRLEEGQLELENQDPHHLVPHDSHPLSHPPPSISGETIECLLRKTTDDESEFDAVMSTLVRLLFHLESAQERRLLGYNVEPLLVRLRELESKYEKQEEEEMDGS